jgi:putative ABC transport system permease protein
VQHLKVQKWKGVEHMNLMENVRMSWESIKVNKMRAILTMLGIIIGIGSVIAILTVGNSLSGSVTSSMSALGSSNIMVFIQQRNVSSNFRAQTAASLAPEAKDLITDDMINAMRQRFRTQVTGVSVNEFIGSGKAKDARKYSNVSVTGVSADNADVNNLKMLKGRFISERDINGTRSTAVVSDRLVDNMFNGNSTAALGKELKVYVGSEIYTFTIAGVYQYEQSLIGGAAAAEQDISTSLYIPVTTATRLSGSNRGYQIIIVKAAAKIDTVAFSKQLQDFFGKYYVNNNDYNITATSLTSIIGQANTILGTLSIAISVIAGISLLVGGIGVMNIMLVSVTERTREIGIRKALGATNNNIRMQFIVESIIVCLIGGVIGVILGGSMGYLGSYLLDNPSLPTVFSIVLAAGFSMAIGIFFGYYPANKAARLNPIEALRYE